MNNWPGKFVIGLTGNIATGKSVVRRMMEHLGAYTIDADALSHRAIAKGAPGYKPVVDTFGKYILDARGEIDRAKLGRVVFNDPEALKVLEEIIHPLVEQAADLMIRRANQRIIVIEAIKLLEGKLAGLCDSIWTSTAPEALQINRLVKRRGMTEQQAIQRIHAQPPQELKIAAASVVIRNDGTFENTWKQVVAAWKVISPTTDTAPLIKRPAGADDLAVQRGRPRDSASIAALITRLSGGTRSLSPDDIMAAFSDKAFLLLISNRELVGLAGWQVENLVSRTTELYLDPVITLARALKALVSEVECASRDLQCEASLIFLPPEMAKQEAVWKYLGYMRRTPKTLGVQAWQDAALESQPANTILFFKQLREDRILRPI
ncbi:MAG: dephospho-CoA kinase [Anaerolineales bacterium]